MDKYGVIGYPLEHSFSKGYFNEKFKGEGISAEYINFEISSIKELDNILRDNPELRGFNVTLPYKEQVIPYLDEISESAKIIGAVNVVKIEQRKGKLYLLGFNSDIIGFQESIQPLLQPWYKKALILGTGGASKSIFQALKNLRIESEFVSRRKSTGVYTYDELTPEVMQQHKIIVNCTPLGISPRINECPPIPYGLLSPDHLLYDLNYNPDLTLFLSKGKERGSTIKNGLEMLLLQAFASWEFWQGLRK